MADGGGWGPGRPGTGGPSGPPSWQPQPPPAWGPQPPPSWQPQPPPGPPGYQAPPGYLPGYPASGSQGYDPPGYGTGVPPGMYFDPASGLTLPRGTQLASSGRRIGAWFLAIPLSIITLGIGYVIWGAVIWGRGQTPALQVLGMRCWRPETGRVAGWWWMALREVVGRLADGILSVITLLVSFVLMLTTRDRKCLHDLVAGTVVLYDPDKVLAR